MAFFFHGYRRFTEYVEILVTRDGLQEIHAKLGGQGYLSPVADGKTLRDAESGVRIEFLVAGEHPPGGKSTPVTLPDPMSVGLVLEGIPFVGVPSLLDMKLASALSSPWRVCYLADAVELIRVLKLPADVVDQLNPFVREKYRELWTIVATHPDEPQ
jgi:hypothetical protein